MDLRMVDGMRQRSRKRLLWAVNAVLAAAVSLAAAVMIWPLDEAAPSASWEEPAAITRTAGTQIEPMSKYAAIHRRDLRKPLFDVVPTTSAKTRTLPPLKVRLTGTAVEEGFSLAMFHTASGELKMVGVGESIEGAEVISITDRSVTLRYGERPVTLTIEKGRAKR